MAGVVLWVAAGTRFAVEIAVLGALAAAGWALGGPAPLRVVVAVALPTLAAAVWGTFCSPRARVVLPRPAVLTVQTAVVGSGVAALVLVGRPGAATALAVAFVLSAVALRVLQGDGDTLART